MSPPPDSSHSVRRVVLPSGKTIEIMYFDGGDADTQAPAAPRDLSVCPACSSTLVHPIDWEEAGESRWMLALRCPNCQWTEEAVFDHDAVELLDARLDDGTQALVRDLRQLTQANMEDEIERFVFALHADHVLPSDF